MYILQRTRLNKVNRLRRPKGTSVKYCKHFNSDPDAVVPVRRTRFHCLRHCAHQRQLRGWVSANALSKKDWLQKKRNAALACTMLPAAAWLASYACVRIFVDWVVISAQLHLKHAVSPKIKKKGRLPFLHYGASVQLQRASFPKLCEEPSLITSRPDITELSELEKTWNPAADVQVLAMQSIPSSCQQCF